MIDKIAKAALVAIAAGSLNLTFVAPAGATPSDQRLCSFASVTDPTVENGQTQTGQINGGPVTDERLGATITLTCTIQVGGANSTHAGTDAVSLSNTGTNLAAACVSSDHSPYWNTGFICPGVGVTVAGQASYVSPEGQPVYMCTQVTVNGEVYYRDSVNATWSASASVTCSEAISQEILPGPLGPVFDILFPIIDGVLVTLFDALTQFEKDVVDPQLCPQLAARSPGAGGVIITPEGDVYIDAVPYGDGDGIADPEEFFWDCPPYVEA